MEEQAKVVMYTKASQSQVGEFEEGDLESVLTELAFYWLFMYYLTIQGTNSPKKWDFIIKIGTA